MKSRAMRRTILIFFLVAIFCMPAFLHVSHTHHDADDCLACPVCIIASRLQALLSLLFLVLLLLCTSLPVCMHLQYTAQQGTRKRSDTLVVLKTRMNN